MADEAPRTFEQALSELENHVRKLDSGELALDDSLQVFESGVKLVRECQELLDGAEQRITELSADVGETPDASQGG